MWVLTNTVATVWAWGMMHKLVSKLVLFYISESCLVMGGVLKVLEGYHHWAARRITGITATLVADGEWE